MLLMTPDIRAKLNKVNLRVNKKTTYRTDTSLYGKTEFWAIAQGKGDCEDYSLAKLKELLKEGIPRKDMSLATCWCVPGDNSSYHAVLIVHTNEGDLVLDNRYDSIKLAKNTGYKFHKLEDFENKRWTLVK